MADRAAKPVVVGVDGSADSRRALGWAARQAELQHLPLVAITAWHYPAPVGVTGLGAGFDFEGAARDLLEAELDEVLGPERNGTTARVESGSAASVLVEATHGAELLVVGSRGHGGLAGLLLGSVSQHCVAHASCTVVVVRGEA
jgi:nucleotide-binding universal stress UspA family protein